MDELWNLRVAGIQEGQDEHRRNVSDASLQGILKDGNGLFGLAEKRERLQADLEEEICSCL